MLEYIIIGFIAFFTSLISGLLGLGGAIILIPAYLYLPQIFGADAIDVKMITGMTSIQVFISALAGMLMHRRKGAVSTKLVYTMGIPILAASFSGAAFSAYVQASVILAVFAFLAVAGAVLMFIRRAQNEDVSLRDLKFSIPGAVLTALFIGFFGGMAGAPGAFILSPVLMTVLKIPTRITIGSTLGIVLISAASASTGKLVTGQVPYDLTLIAAAAAVPGVLFGSYFSHQVKTKTLRYILAVLIAAVGFEMWYQIIF